MLTKLMKVAWVRIGDEPYGTPGTMQLRCPCGRGPTYRPSQEVPDEIGCACGTTYDGRGWILSTQNGQDHTQSGKE